MKRHRNSQKRIHTRDKIYFITTNTKDRYPYFEEDVLCNLLVLHLELCVLLYYINIYAYKINPEHVHLLLQWIKHGLMENKYCYVKNPEGDPPQDRLRDNRDV